MNIPLYTVYVCAAGRALNSRILSQDDWKVRIWAHLEESRGLKVISHLNVSEAHNEPQTSGLKLDTLLLKTISSAFWCWTTCIRASSIQLVLNTFFSWGPPKKNLYLFWKSKNIFLHILLFKLAEGNVLS